MTRRLITYAVLLLVVISVAVITGTIVKNSQGVEGNDDTTKMIQTVGQQYIRKGCIDLEDTRETLKGALIKIINRGDRNLKKFYKEGAITQAQYDRSLKSSVDSKSDLDTLTPLNCKALMLKENPNAQ